MQHLMFAHAQLCVYVSQYDLYNVFVNCLQACKQLTKTLGSKRPAVDRLIVVYCSSVEFRHCYQHNCEPLQHHYTSYITTLEHTLRMQKPCRWRSLHVQECGHGLYMVKGVWATIKDRMMFKQNSRCNEPMLVLFADCDINQSMFPTQINYLGY